MGEFAGKDDLEARLRAHVEYLAGTLGKRNPVHYTSLGLEEGRRCIERGLVGELGSLHWPELLRWPALA